MKNYYIKRSTYCNVIEYIILSSHYRIDFFFSFIHVFFNVEIAALLQPDTITRINDQFDEEKKNGTTWPLKLSLTSNLKKGL